MDHNKQLNIISRAWGRTQDGYCFFPWIDREEQEAKGIRRAGYHEGPAFHWPTEKLKILKHMSDHTDDDLYWCPSLFEYKTRESNVAMDECALWADLDEVNPKTIDDYPPTVAWETSPGRYQALWIMNQGDIPDASFPGRENQRLTYHLGADLSGWDTTQLMRIPGWVNHKPEYRDKKTGASPQGVLLWANGRTYLSDDFEDLPEVRGSSLSSDITDDALIAEIKNVDNNTVYARVKLKLTQRIRDFIRAKQATGDRSSVLWEIERSLADAGCTLAEIVSLVEDTVWNKYDGRADEWKRLILEASKALAQKSEEVKDAELEEEVLREEVSAAVPIRADILLANVEPPKWLIKDILTKGGLGFIAGQPKSFKSWFGLDLAISVATGTRFLNYFDVLLPGPVLYIQEEDSPITVKDRWTTVNKAKQQMPLTLKDNEIWLEPMQSVPSDAPLNMLLQGGLTVSEGAWQEWLDEKLREGDSGNPYQLLIIDTMMMTAGDVEENRSQQMTTLYFKPLKQLARKHGTALILVHHYSKGDGNGKRAGQRLLGSVANHAWAEDSMYLELSGNHISMQTESKSWKANTYQVHGVGQGKGWHPEVSTQAKKITQNGNVISDKRLWVNDDPLVRAVTTLGGRAHARTIAEQMGLDWSKRQSLNNKLNNLTRQGLLTKQRDGNQILWMLPNGAQK